MGNNCKPIVQRRCINETQQIRIRHRSRIKTCRRILLLGRLRGRHGRSHRRTWPGSRGCNHRHLSLTSRHCTGGRRCRRRRSRRSEQIGLSEYRISDWRILETIGLSISDQTLNLSDYRLSDSQITVGCPALFIGLQNFRVRIV